MAFTVRERDDFALVDLTVGFAGLVVQGDLRLQGFRSSFFHGQRVDVRGLAFAHGLDEEYFQRLLGRRGQLYFGDRLALGRDGVELDFKVRLYLPPLVGRAACEALGLFLGGAEETVLIVGDGCAVPFVLLLHLLLSLRFDLVLFDLEIGFAGELAHPRKILLGNLATSQPPRTPQCPAFRLPPHFRGHLLL